MYSASSSFLKVVLAYTVLILGVILWSGNGRSKTVYNRYNVDLDLLHAKVCSPESLSAVLTHGLQFECVKNEDKILCNLPDARALQLTPGGPCDRDSGSSLDLIFTVRGDLKNVRKQFLEGLKIHEHFGIPVTEIQKEAGYKLFSVLADPHLKLSFRKKTLF